MKEQWSAFLTLVKPHVQLLRPKIADLYHSLKSYIGPHSVKVLKDLVSYAQASASEVNLNLFISFLFVVSRSLEVCRFVLTVIQCLLRFFSSIFHVMIDLLVVSLHGFLTVTIFSCYLQDHIPILKEQWSEFISSSQPRLQLLIERIVDKYHASKSFIEPHAVRALKVLNWSTQVSANEVKIL